MVAEVISDLERLNRKFRPALIAFFSRRTASHAEAEDLTQEVFARLAQSKAETVDSPDVFIFRIAMNLLRDHWRQNRVRNSYRTSAEENHGASIDILDPHRIVAARETIEIL